MGAAAWPPYLPAKRYLNLPPQWSCRARKKICKNRLRCSFESGAENVRRRARTQADFSGFVLISVLTGAVFDLISGHFTYENRRGRESNPRIVVAAAYASIVQEDLFSDFFIADEGENEASEDN